jgi:long-chain acyl-CoA synthetase
VKFLRQVSWKITGSEHFNEIKGPVIFASNHQSHVDTHVIMDTLPSHLRKTTAVAAAFDHFADREGTSPKKRLIQFLVAALWHAFGVERIKSPLRSIRTMQDLLHRGWSIVIYPEGTRSRSGEIASFKRGVAIIAKKSSRPIIPICVQGSRNVLPEATYIPRKGVIQISYGKPLHFVEDESSAEFIGRVEAAVREMAGSA